MLGIGPANADVLRQALQTAARTQEVDREVLTLFGRKYEMRLMVNGPRGAKVVRAVWIVERGQDRPRLVTCYVE